MFKKTIQSVLIIGLTALNTAQAVVMDEADGNATEMTIVEQGKALHDASCMSCHTSKYPDEPNTVYSREDRTVTKYSQLTSRVQLCGTRAVDTAWFDEDFDAVTTYLNTEFYHFDIE